MDSTLSILGSLASIAGAIWAFKEARSSAKSATQAKALHDEIIHRRKMLEVSQIHSDTKRILSVVSKVGPSTNARMLRGVNGAEIAKEVEEYTRALLEQSAHFSEAFGNDARSLCENLRPEIEKLAEAIPPQDKKTHGMSIYYQIENFMPIAKRMADEKREQAPNKH
jgi:hypothetical protein